MSVARSSKSTPKTAITRATPITPARKIRNTRSPATKPNISRCTRAQRWKKSASCVRTGEPIPEALVGISDADFCQSCPSPSLQISPTRSNVATANLAALGLTCVNTLQFPSRNAVEHTKSGHPCLPWAPPMAYVLDRITERLHRQRGRRRVMPDVGGVCYLASPSSKTLATLPAWLNLPNCSLKCW